jgi:predicted MPP superfamily phosphohydrolase
MTSACLRTTAIAWLAIAAATACHLGPADTAGPATVVSPTPSAPPVPLPNREGSLKFAVHGDFGNGTAAQRQMAEQMFKTHKAFPYELVILTGDNIYGPERPQDFAARFEIPYKPLIDAGVKFYASLGNHDSREQANYKLFNMEGKLYYSFKAPKQNVRFYALETTYPEPAQFEWLAQELKSNNEDWKIAYFHHPLYSSGERHGSHIELREKLEPLFIEYNVSVVFTGHDHFYERVKPQKGIPHFVVGSGGQLRRGNLDPRTGITAKGFDTDLAFLVAEIYEDVMTFNAVSRTGAIIDSGIIQRRLRPAK